MRQLRGTGPLTQPLPEAEQPDQEDPVGTAPTASLDPNASPGPSARPCGLPGDAECRRSTTRSGSAQAERRSAARPDASRLQLFDHTTQRWVEFAQPDDAAAYLIADPQRYVDESGAVLFRFVNRTDRRVRQEQKYFQLQIRSRA